MGTLSIVNKLLCNKLYSIDTCKSLNVGPSSHVGWTGQPATNSLHLINPLLQRLCGAQQPHWVNRLAYLSSWMPFLLNCLPPAWLTPGENTTLYSSCSRSHSRGECVIVPIVCLRWEMAWSHAHHQLGIYVCGWSLLWLHNDMCYAPGCSRVQHIYVYYIMFGFSNVTLMCKFVSCSHTWLHSCHIATTHVQSYQIMVVKGSHDLAGSVSIPFHSWAHEIRHSRTVIHDPILIRTPNFIHSNSQHSMIDVDALHL